MTMPYDDAGTSGVQRFEFFTGRGKRRDWPPEVKASIVAESFSGQETVSAVARRHGLSPTQLFNWRRDLRKRLEGQGLTLPAMSSTAPAFVPAVVDPLPASGPLPAVRHSAKRHRPQASAIELEIDGIAVRIGRGADAGMITAVIEALRAPR
ncbi:IS66-like element accessory protein TnpA [Sphingopyxis sp. NJF-3]